MFSTSQRINYFTKMSWIWTKTLGLEKLHFARDLQIWTSRRRNFFPLLFWYSNKLFLILPYIKWKPKRRELKYVFLFVWWKWSNIYDNSRFKGSKLRWNCQFLYVGLILIAQWTLSALPKKNDCHWPRSTWDIYVAVAPVWVEKKQPRSNNHVILNNIWYHWWK